MLMTVTAGLVASKGVDAVSLREIADEAGVTPAMINYYFSDKQGLMHAVLERGLESVPQLVKHALSRARPVEVWRTADYPGNGLHSPRHIHYTGNASLSNVTSRC